MTQRRGRRTQRSEAVAVLRAGAPRPPARLPPSSLSRPLPREHSRLTLGRRSGLWSARRPGLGRGPCVSPQSSKGSPSGVRGAVRPCPGERLARPLSTQAESQRSARAPPMRPQSLSAEDTRETGSPRGAVRSGIRGLACEGRGSGRYTEAWLTPGVSAGWWGAWSRPGHWAATPCSRAQRLWPLTQVPAGGERQVWAEKTLSA